MVFVKDDETRGRISRWRHVFAIINKRGRIYNHTVVSILNLTPILHYNPKTNTKENLNFEFKCMYSIL
jgi:hypothetical protein